MQTLHVAEERERIWTESDPYVGTTPRGSGRNNNVEYTNPMYLFIRKSKYNLEKSDQMCSPFHQSLMTTRNETRSYMKQLDRGSKHKSK